MEVAGIVDLKDLAEKSSVSYKVLQNLGSAKEGGSVSAWSALASFFDREARAILGIPRVTIDYLLGNDPPESKRALPALPVCGTAGASLTRFGEAADLGERTLKDCFLVEIVDRSMEPVVRPGEMVIVSGGESPEAPRPGDVVIFDSDSEGHWLVKQWIETENGHQFRSLNMREALETIIKKEKPKMFRVVGVLLGKRP